jgi:hypothetical protein
VLAYPLFLLLNSGSLGAAIVAVAVVSLVTVLTLRETAARPLAALGAETKVASAAST